MPDPGASLPDAAKLYDVIGHTWAPSSSRRHGPWMIREGRGGGSRVSSATAEDAFDATDLKVAERAMTDLDQRPLFMIREGEEDLDRALAHSGYTVADPVVLYALPVSAMADAALSPMAAFVLWPMLAIMADLWAAGGVGPARLAVMQRVTTPKTAILARQNDRPAGVAFVGLHDSVAMIHAIEVAAEMRRQGVGRNMLVRAARWSQDRGAAHLALAVTRANGPANALYASLGMKVVGQYHYRIK